jgi:protein-tyrosine-phosphatase
MSLAPVPLFLCLANCCRSVLASYLYQDLLPDAPVLSAGLQAGEQVSDRALAMLAYLGIDAARHQPRQLDRGLCEEASGLFVMAPPYVRRLLVEYGSDLASKAYLFANPFIRPRSLSRGEYTVWDPSFDERPVQDLVRDYAWMRERVLEINRALLGVGPPLIAAADYLDLLDGVDPSGH